MAIEISIGRTSLGITRDDIRTVLLENTCDQPGEAAIEAAVDEVMDDAGNLDLGELAEFIVEQSGVAIEEDEEDEE